MGEHRRKADGRRVFSTEFKRTAVQRILTGEKTLAELSRELDISPSVIRNWKRTARRGLARRFLGEVWVNERG
jgi:transposase-like protein